MPITLGSFSTVQSSEAVADSNMSSGSSTPIDSLNHKHLLELRLHITSGPTAAGNIDLYRRRADSPIAAPVPGTSYKHDYVGTFNVNTGTGYYYSGYISNLGPDDMFYWYNNTGSSVTATLEGRTAEYS